MIGEQAQTSEPDSGIGCRGRVRVWVNLDADLFEQTRLFERLPSAKTV